jgi:hypothetical protein
MDGLIRPVAAGGGRVLHELWVGYLAREAQQQEQAERERAGPAEAKQGVIAEGVHNIEHSK